MKKIIIELIICLIIVVAACWALKLSPLSNNHQPAALPVTSEATTPDSLASLDPALRALTIPGLRERNYDSQLTIEETLEQTAAYTAYLASYDSDGSKVYGLLAVPGGDMPKGGWPAIILMHGYVNPKTYQTNGSSYSGWWQAAARDGRFVIFKPDMRGHGQSEGVATGPYFGADYVIDALNARQALANWEQVDNERIGLWGHSMSGNTILRAMAARPDLVPAISLWAGAVYTYQDLLDYWITDPSYSPQRDQATTHAHPQASASGQLFNPHRQEQMNLNTPFWQAMIPTNFLSDITGAIDIHHASDDSVVSVHYSQDLNDLLDQTSIKHEVHIYPSGGHNMTGATFNSAISRTLDFFSRNLVDGNR